MEKAVYFLSNGKCISIATNVACSGSHTLIVAENGNGTTCTVKITNIIMIRLLLQHHIRIQVQTDILPAPKQNNS